MHVVEILQRFYKFKSWEQFEFCELQHGHDIRTIYVICMAIVLNYNLLVDLHVLVTSERLYDLELWQL